jgi:UPF0716 protein FxsA
MPLLVLLVLVLAPLAELFVVIKVGQAIGALATIALLLAGTALGMVLLRAQGRLAWRRFVGALSAGRLPAAEVVDGALIVLGASLLMLPGFISDALGLLLLIPPTRVGARRFLLSGVRARALMVVARTDAAWRRRARQDYDVDSTAHDIDRGRLQR